MAASIFGDTPSTSMNAPTISVSQLAARLLRGDLSQGDVEGANSLSKKQADAQPVSACGTQSECLQRVVDTAAKMPPIVFPPEVMNPK